MAGTGLVIAFTLICLHQVRDFPPQQRRLGSQVCPLTQATGCALAVLAGGRTSMRRVSARACGETAPGVKTGNRGSAVRDVEIMIVCQYLAHKEVMTHNEAVGGIPGQVRQVSRAG